MRKNCLAIAGFEDKGRSQKPKDIHGLQKLEKARNGFFPISFRLTDREEGFSEAGRYI